MALEYIDRSSPADYTLDVGSVQSAAQVRANTPDSITMAITDDNVQLIALGGTNPPVDGPAGDTLRSLGGGDLLFTDGATQMTFIDDGTQTEDGILIDSATQQNFQDVIQNFKAGDSLLVYGFKAGPPSVIPGGLPTGVTVTDTAQGAQLNLDFTGGGALPTASVLFAGLSALQLGETHQFLTGTDPTTMTPYLFIV